MNWDDYRYLLAVARRGTLSAAAQELEVSQPTVGRRIAALEQRLGAKLFVRTPAGFTLSDAGADMREQAERIERDVLAAERRVSGRDVGLRGRVRVTASEWMCTSVIAPMLHDLVVRHPQLEIELVAEHRHLNLARGEADIALRPRRFQHADVVQRAVGAVRFGLYAAPRYIAARGLPQAGNGSGHVVIGMLDSVGDVVRDWLGSVLPRSSRSVRTNGRDAMVSLATAGVGLACLARVVGDELPGLQHVPMTPEAPAPTLWLGMSRDARSSPRVRLVAERFAKELHVRLR